MAAWGEAVALFHRYPTTLTLGDDAGETGGNLRFAGAHPPDAARVNAAFALRGLTSGALVSGLALAIFWKKGGGVPVITGMIVSLTAMTAIQLLPKLDWTRALWMKTVGTEIFWPWYTLIGAIITVLTAWLVRRLLPPPDLAAQASKPAVPPN